MDVELVCDWSYRSHIVVRLRETMVPQFESVTRGRLLPEMAQKLSPRLETPASSASYSASHGFREVLRNRLTT